MLTAIKHKAEPVLSMVRQIDEKLNRWHTRTCTLNPIVKRSKSNLLNKFTNKYQ